MTISSISFATAAETLPAGWAVQQITNTGVISLPDALGAATGWSAQWNAAPETGGAANVAVAGSGDLSWAVAGSLNSAGRSNTVNLWNRLNITNLNNSKQYTIRCASSITVAGRVTAWRVNGGAAQTLLNDNGAGGANLTNDVEFVGMPAVGGLITVEFTRDATSSGSAYANAIQIEELLTADTTAPTFTTAPAVAATSETGHTITSTINESGTIYGVRLVGGATAPSSAQVKAGQDSAGAAALEALSVAATAEFSADLSFSLGAAATAYDYYVVTDDYATTPNLQATPTLVSATTAAAAVPGIGQLTVQFEGVAINVADWHIITRLAADQSILYNQTAQSSNASGNIAAFATTSGNVGDPVRVEGLSAADAYSFVIEQNLGNIA
jgi:hypothetical protein